MVWSWDTLAHIDLATENANWHDVVTWPNVGLNAIHMNSIQEVGNQIIMSARDLDAVYDIDKTTGNIIWKLGGTTTPQSLTVVGNTYPQVFSGQHDARHLADGSITVHDNASQETGKATRALRFTIDTATHTATIVEDVTDPMQTTPVHLCAAGVSTSSARGTGSSTGVNRTTSPSSHHWGHQSSRSNSMVMTPTGRPWCRPPTRR